MNTFLKKLAGFSIGPIVGAMIAFITIPITTYFISPEEYGKASMFTVYQVLIATFMYLGLDQAYIREYHSEDDKNNLMKNALAIPLILSLILFAVIFFAREQVSFLLFGNSNYELAGVLFGVTIVCLVIERFILHSIRMRERAIEFSFVNILIKLLILIFTIIFVIFIRRDFLSVVYSSAIGQILGDLYLIIRYREFLNFKSVRPNKKLIRRMLIFGVPLILAASLNNLLNSIDRMILRVQSTFFEIGIFSAALKVSATLNILQTSFTSFWVPTAYRWYENNKEVKHYELVSQALLFVMSILFIFILTFKDFIILLLSPDYESAKLIIGFLCLQPIFYTISETTTLGIVFSRKSYLNIYISFLSLIPNVIINILLVNKFGALGAAIATGISFFIFFISRSYFSNKYWIGFSYRRHIIVFMTMLILSWINSQVDQYIVLYNVFGFLILVLIQYPTITRIYKIYKHDRKNWDFN